MSTDFFTTDFSFLGSVEEQSAKPARATSAAGQRQLKVYEIAGEQYSIGRSPETCAKISAGKRGKRMSQDSIDKMVKTRQEQGHPMQGRRHTEETRALMRERAQMRPHRGGPKVGHQVDQDTRNKISATLSRPVMTPNGVYPSVRAIAEASGMPMHTVRRWLKRYPNDYYFIKDKK